MLCSWLVSHILLFFLCKLSTFLRSVPHFLFICCDNFPSITFIVLKPCSTMFTGTTFFTCCFCFHSIQSSCIHLITTAICQLPVFLGGGQGEAGVFFLRTLYFVYVGVTLLAKQCLMNHMYGQLFSHLHIVFKK